MTGNKQPSDSTLNRRSLLRTGVIVTLAGPAGMGVGAAHGDKKKSDKQDRNDCPKRGKKDKKDQEENPPEDGNDDGEEEEDEEEVPSQSYTVTFNVEILDNVPEDVEIPPVELDVGNEGLLSGGWVYDGSTLSLSERTYDFGGGIYPYPDEQIASNFYIAERPGIVELDSDQEVTYVLGYDSDE